MLTRRLIVLRRCPHCGSTWWRLARSAGCFERCTAMAAAAATAAIGCPAGLTWRSRSCRRSLASSRRRWVLASVNSWVRRSGIRHTRAREPQDFWCRISACGVAPHHSRAGLGDRHPHAGWHRVRGLDQPVVLPRHCPERRSARADTTIHCNCSIMCGERLLGKRSLLNRTPAGRRPLVGRDTARSPSRVILIEEGERSFRGPGATPDRRRRGRPRLADWVRKLCDLQILCTWISLACLRASACFAGPDIVTNDLASR